MQSKSLVAALVFLSALFVGFSWWVYFSSAGKLSLWWAVLATLLPLLVAACLWAVQRWTAKKGAKNLETALADDSARERREASSARGVELDRLRSEFERAIKALKGSKLANGSRRSSEALYRLPWYAIIGPPASGKTTVLRNSGLKFPYLPGTGDRLKGIGGTRNCDWWLTNHAILLDTAGRWSVEENERDEWLVFLDLLKRHRGARPLNGIIAAISIAGDDATSISGAAEDDLKEIALRMRERLDEITGRLGVALPVYLLFTKCDLINGFVESFGNLSGDRRKQIWGFTAPVLQGARRDPGNYFAQQFELLRDELERRAVVRMGDEVNPQIIPTIYEFPAQFGALKEKLTFFVDELFDASAYRETPLLRGAYFTSGTQEGAPADLLFEDIAGALNLRPKQYESREEQKGYFLHDMLLRVVFEDRNLATTSEVELVRQHWKRRALTSALFVSSLAGTTLATNSCQHNLHAIGHTEGSFTGNQSARKASERSAAADARPSHLPELLALEQDVARYERGGRGLVDVGLYHGERISPALERYYQNALAESVVRPLLNQNQVALLTRTQQLVVSAGNQRPSDVDAQARDELRDALSLQLLLTTPRESCAPKPLSRKDFIVERLLALWQQASPQDSTELEQRKLLLGRYLELESHEASPTNLGRDPRVIAQARRALGDDDQVARLLQRIVAAYPAQPQTLAKLAGTSLAIEAPGAVGGAFSREAWARISREIDAEDFRESDGDWVFGCGAARHDAARAELDVETFRQAYLTRYEKSWREFLGGVSGRAPANAADAETMLTDLVTRPGVLGNLLTSVRDNTHLPLARTGVADGVDQAGAQLGAALGTNIRSTDSGGGDKTGSGALKQVVNNRLNRTLSREGLMAMSSETPAAPQQIEPLHQSFADFASFGAAAQGGGASTLDQYRRLLEPVLVALKAYRQDESKVDALAAATQSALENTELLLRGQGGSWTSQLHDLLVPVLAGTLDLVQRGRGAQFGRAYCDAVYAPFQRELAGRFPFKPDSAEPASMAAFARFFQPGSGSIWAFQAAHLGGYVSSEGGRYRFTGSQAQHLFRNELIEFLQRAAAISQAFFPEGSGGGGAGPRMPFRVRVRGAAGYSLTTFRSGAQSVQYDSGAESWTRLEWPGDQGRPGVSLAVTPYQGPGPRPLSFDNPWGLFMILQPRAGAQVFEQNSKQLSVGWRPKGGQNFVKVDFASDDPRSPLLAAAQWTGGNRLFPLTAPARISQLGAGCAPHTR